MVKVYDLAFCVLGVAAFSVLDAFEVFWPFREQLHLQGSVIVGSGLSLSAWVCLYTGLSQKSLPLTAKELLRATTLIFPGCSGGRAGLIKDL